MNSQLPVGRRIATLIVAATLVGFGSAALADDVYNTLDGDIDATHELMMLAPGAVGTTTLQIRIQDHPDHAGCNLQGEPFKLKMSAGSYDASVATVAFDDGNPATLNDDTFDDCDDVLTVKVTAQPVVVESMTTVTFTGEPLAPANNPKGTWTYDGATFDVKVTPDTTQPPTVCDADPAAPAWANAILRRYAGKNKSAGFNNAIADVAKAMGPGATFDGIAKSVHPDYEAAVYAFLNARSDVGGLIPNTDTPDWASIQRPGWECATQTPPSI